MKKSESGSLRLFDACIKNYSTYKFFLLTYEKWEVKSSQPKEANDFIKIEPFHQFGKFMSNHINTIVKFIKKIKNHRRKGYNF